MKKLCCMLLFSVFIHAQQEIKNEFIIPKKTHKKHRSRAQLKEDIACTAGDCVQNTNQALQKTLKNLCPASLQQDQELLTQICKTQKILLKIVRELVQEETKQWDTLQIQKLEDMHKELCSLKKHSANQQDASWWQIIRKKIKSLHLS